MNDDLDIKKLFDDCQPELTDSADFLAGLEKKLDSVEDIKVYHDTQVRKYRTGALAAFIFGGIMGALFIALIFLKPSSSPQLALLLDSQLYVFLISNKIAILVGLGAFITAFGLIPMLKSDRTNA